MKKYLLGFVALLVLTSIAGCSVGQKAQGGVIYYVDDETGQVLTKNVEIKNEDDVWNALQNMGMLTEDCQLISININEKKKNINLDFDSETGNWIRSMGTTGEIEIIGCIVNSFLDTYECNEIQLTEEGNVLESSHGADYSGYLNHISFE